MVTPDPRSLVKLVPKTLLNKINQAGVCLIADTDGTLIDSSPMFCRWLNQNLGCKVKPADIKRYDLNDAHPDALKMLQKHVFPNAEMNRGLPLVCGAKEAVEQVASCGVPVVILTSRPANNRLVRVTVDNIEEHGIPFDLFIFSQDKKATIEALECLGDWVTVVVDDDPGVITAVAQLKGVRATIFTASYNLDFELEGVSRAGKDSDDPDKWAVVQQIIEEVIKSR